MRITQLFPLALAAGAFGKSLEDVLTEQSETLSTIHSWLQSQMAALAILSGAQGVTILAPSNKAMDELYKSNFSAHLASDSNLLTAFLSYHVLNGVYYSDHFINAGAANFPTFMNNYPCFSNVTGGQVVQGRVKDGGVTFVSGHNTESAVQTYDLHYDNGVVHIIDSVLCIPHNLTGTVVSKGHTAMAGAIRETGVEAAFNHARDVTIFSPSNNAFNAIGSLAINMAIEEVAGILKYHVISGQVQYSWQIMDGSQAMAINSGSINFRVEDDGAWFVNSARVIASDILIGNGVLHIIDGVLNPSNQTATPNPAAATQAPVFDGATTTTCVPFTSALASTSTVTSEATAASTASADAQRTGSVGQPSNSPSATSQATSSPISSLASSPACSRTMSATASTTKSATVYATPSDGPFDGDSGPPQNSGPRQTAAVGAAALLGGAAAFVNWEAAVQGW
ncbi:FAS1 domain-containing protein [Parathielavia appendiculata]|uniref:FAS1 domain-containing protein n=1 Tax=Parathielavia appendiculata TaxID=2587402 RepID=A0AAN6TPE7_9PEZI|nr:FAS1 domain-containing protein [Parathielavia appendiculata]